MSLPPGFLDELRDRTSIVQVVGRKVMWDNRKSNPGKGDMWAPCPFHHEKTASFHVDDRKGFYYCFGCHAKGDAIGFVKDTENVDFMEAIRILAEEAGMKMPERDPEAQQKADKRTRLTEIMEMAVQFFRLQLRTNAGAAARDYLNGRGLNEDALAQFDIGYAPDGWQGLLDHLTGKGIEEQLILDCGLAKPGRDGNRPYDVFRNRIMFPIRDARGRCIAFGGRAMDPADNAKYLNSPETEIFDKSRTLYHLGPAREATGKGAPLIVAEGYMDVIALARAGFGASVAPLGTAVTETQLQMLWRISDEPLIALDGDQAGIRAAHRVMDLSLPLLEAGKSLRFVLMPQGQDPDDLIRAQGAGGFQKLIDASVPMVDLLWQRETDGVQVDSPERRAALDKSLRMAIGRIKDPSVRAHYGQAIKDLRWRLFNPARTGKRKGSFTKQDPVRPGTRQSLLASNDQNVTNRLRVDVILATLIKTPEVLEKYIPQIETLTCYSAQQSQIRDAILHHDPNTTAPLQDALSEEIGGEALEKLFNLPHVAIMPSIRRPGDEELADATVSGELMKCAAFVGLDEEIAEAADDLSGVADEAVTWRLGQAAEARNRAMKSQQEDKTEFDKGDNGALINRDERQAFDALLQQIRFSKSK